MQRLSLRLRSKIPMVYFHVPCYHTLIRYWGRGTLILRHFRHLWHGLGVRVLNYIVWDLLSIVSSLLKIARALKIELLRYRRPLDVETLRSLARCLDCLSLCVLTGCKEVCEWVHNVCLRVDVCNRSKICLIQGGMRLLVRW